MSNHTSPDSEKNHIVTRVQEITQLKNQVTQLCNQRLQEILGDDYEFVTRIEAKKEKWGEEEVKEEDDEGSGYSFSEWRDSQLNTYIKKEKRVPTYEELEKRYKAFFGVLGPSKNDYERIEELRKDIYNIVFLKEDSDIGSDFNSN